MKNKGEELNNNEIATSSNLSDEDNQIINTNSSSESLDMPNPYPTEYNSTDKEFNAVRGQTPNALEDFAASTSRDATDKPVTTKNKKFFIS